MKLFIRKLKLLIEIHLNKCRCSGYGVYPYGLKCPGCKDCRPGDYK